MIRYFIVGGIALCGFAIFFFVIRGLYKEGTVGILGREKGGER